jgi:hypothetical protein
MNIMSSALTQVAQNRTSGDIYCLPRWFSQVKTIPITDMPRIKIEMLVNWNLNAFLLPVHSPVKMPERLLITIIVDQRAHLNAWVSNRELAMP